VYEWPTLKVPRKSIGAISKVTNWSCRLSDFNPWDMAIISWAILTHFLASFLRNSRAAARTRAEMNGQLRTNRFVARELARHRHFPRYHSPNHRG
jgi:hypothetical protein